jgi:hypothetical protein
MSEMNKALRPAQSIAAEARALGNMFLTPRLLLVFEFFFNSNYIELHFLTRLYRVKQGYSVLVLALGRSGARWDWSGNYATSGQSALHESRHAALIGGANRSPGEARLSKVIREKSRKLARFEG